MAMNDVVRVSAPNTTKAEQERRRKIADEERDRNRPRLERVNPNAMNADEARAVLRQLRGEPLSRGDTRKITWKEGNAFDKFVALTDATLEGLEVLAAAKGPGPKVYGGSDAPFYALKKGRVTAPIGAGPEELGRAQDRVTEINRAKRSRVRERLAAKGTDRNKETIQRNVRERIVVGQGVKSSNYSRYNPDSEPTFSNKRIDPDSGYVIYDVEDSEAGMNATRGAVNRTLGVKANPWCLVVGDGKGNLLRSTDGADVDAFYYWNKYNAAGRQIAFDPKTGKVVAFQSSETSEPKWWNRLDKNFQSLKGVRDAEAVKNTENTVTPPIQQDQLREEYHDLHAADDMTEADWDAFERGHTGAVKGGSSFGALARQASKGGNAPGESKSSAVPKGHNPALDGYQGPRIMINPTTFRNGKDALCVAWNEAIRIFMEANDYEPQSEPTDKQRQFFADTPYADDELQLRRTILARICVFDTSVKDPTDDQLSESAQILRTIIDSGFAKTDDEIEKCERLARAIEAAVGAEPVEPREEPLRQAPLEPGEPRTQAAYDAGETEEDELKRLAEGDTGKTLQEDTSTLEERQQFLEERGMDTSLAETGSMDQLVRMHEQENQGSDGTAGVDMPASADGKDVTGKDVQDLASGTQSPQQGQPTAVMQRKQDTVQTAQDNASVPGLVVTGSRNNIYTYNGRRISEREASKLQQAASGAASGLPSQPLQTTGQDQTKTQPVVAQQPQVSGGIPGLVVTGSRNNVYTYYGRRISKREARRLGLVV